MLREEEGFCILRKTKVGSGGLECAGASLNTDGVWNLSQRNNVGGA